MKDNIREYQKQIIDIILDRTKNDKKETFVEIPTGAGKNIIIKKLIQMLDGNILLITKSVMQKLNFMSIFKDYKNVKITTYYNFVYEKNKTNYLILTDLESISESVYSSICRIYKNSNIIGFLNSSQMLEKENNWLSKKNISYKLTLQEIIEKGYINPFQGETKFLDFVEKMLKNLGFVNIDREKLIKTNEEIIRPDFVVNNDKNEIIIEVKDYRSKYISSNIINGAVNQLYYNTNALSKECKYTVLVVSCNISEETKKEYYEKKEVLILDIANLIYLSYNNKELMGLLAEAINYDIYPITPIKPIDFKLFKIKEKSKTEEKSIKNQAINFIEQLQNLNSGNEKRNAQKYQNLCVKIIKFLFETEFTRISEQDSTEDKLFRRDLLCGIKGTSEFWKILIQHYNSRFVVFEFKNYKEEIEQNLVYITGKYLYKAALRNVAIMISRKGFSYNAHKLAIGMLVSEEKLILDLNDDDIITMLRMKADEQDPSDYLLNKLEEFLMLIST